MLRLLILFTLTQLAYSGETASKLYGSWKSDITLTSEYLNKHAKLTEYQRKVLPKIFSNSIVTYKSNGTGLIETKEIVIPKQNGEEWKIPAINIGFTYEILGEAANQLVIKTTLKEDLFADSPFCIIRFEESDTYSISISDGISDINGREFFKRINITKKANKSEMTTPRKPCD